MNALVTILPSGIAGLILLVGMVCLVFLGLFFCTIGRYFKISWNSRKGWMVSGVVALFALIFLYSCQCLWWWQTTIVHRLSPAELSTLRDAASNEDKDAQERLGRVYEFGAGVSQNHAEAIKWFTKAAQQGKSEVLFSIAAIYEDGAETVQQDVEQAYFWYTLAAARSNNRNYAATRRDRVGPLLTEEQRQALDRRAEVWLNAHPK